jgi:hypothetical protein
MCYVTKTLSGDIDTPWVVCSQTNSDNTEFTTRDKVQLRNNYFAWWA